ncbi:MAG: carbon-phosphorus lyase complex subunit PhnI [Anaerolineae bacterium]|nr:carbon-phosphorus lyase complex subunit PhnI [Anaerolineae bacterium]
MAYVATKGGEKAIQESEKLYHQLKKPVTPEFVQEIMDTMPYLVDRVMGEGSLYAPDLAALAIAQSGGDLYEAVLLLRAYRSTQPRLAYAKPVTVDETLTLRRISAAFKDIPGGQILGPSLDYSHRILKLDVLDGPSPTDEEEDTAVEPAEKPAKPQYPLVADWLRQQGMMTAIDVPEEIDAADIPDVTRDPVMMPAPRAHRLQALARADTGGVLALGYASMRGYGFVHPTVNELRLAYAEVQVKHPVTGEYFSAGRVRVSQAEIVTKGKSTYKIGFTATMGWNEVKLIAGATLDMEMSQTEPHPALNEDFVLYHTEPIESSGFCIHFKLPHYVTFSSSMDNMRKVITVLYGAEAAGKDADEREEDAEKTATSEIVTKDTM